MTSLHVSCLAILLRELVDDMAIQNLKASSVCKISEVPGDITCYTVSGVLNLTIDLKLTDSLTKSK
jgi:hypothetical protein